MQPRTSERFRYRVRVFFAGIENDVEGEGTVADLSKGGCRIESETQPPIGTEVKLSLFMPDFSWPMKVDRAAVQWVKGETFGVRFLSLQSAQQERLTRCIMKLKQQAGY